MRPEDLERILREDDTIEPSSGFTERVMRAVRDEAEDRGALRFPWRRVVPGFALAGALLVVAIVAVIGSDAPPAASSGPIADGVAAALRFLTSRMAALTLGPLVGSWILVRFSLRLAGATR